MSDPVPAPRRLHLAMLLAALATLLATVPGTWVQATYSTRTTADEPHYLLTAISIAEDGDLDLANQLGTDATASFHAAPLPIQERRLADGRMLAPHDPLLPVLLAGGWALGGWVGAKLTVALLAGALAAMLVFTAVRRLRVPPGIACAGVLVFGASLPFAPYATQLYPAIPAALVMTAAVAAATGPLGRTGLLVAGLGVVALPWLAVKLVPIAGALTLAVAWRLWAERRSGALAALVAGLTAAAGAYVALHLWLYDGLTVYAAGAHFAGDGQLSVMGTSPDLLGRSSRLVGLLVGRRFGIAAWQPAWLLVLPAIGALLRRRPAGWDLIVGPLLVGWLSATFLALTMQGWWIPGRQVVVVLPLAVLAVLWWVGQHRGRRLLLIVSGLLGVTSYGWLLVEGLTGRLTWVVDFFTTAGPWYRLWQHLLPNEMAPQAADWTLHTAWALGAVGLLWWGWRAGARQPVMLSRSR